MTDPAGSETDGDRVEAAYRRLAALYARAMDRNEPALLADVLTHDVSLEGPGFRTEGLETVAGSPAMLREMYLMTQHVIHNQTLVVRGDEAEGETYCTANHIMRPAADGAGHSALVWALRYQDRLRREDGAWRISARMLIVDWSETRPVSLGAAG